MTWFTTDADYQKFLRKHYPLPKSGSVFLKHFPDTLPPDKVLVHNHVTSGKLNGRNGFKAWLESLDTARLTPCPCNRCSGRPHFIVRLVLREPAQAAE